MNWPNYKRMNIQDEKLNKHSQPNQIQAYTYIFSAEIHELQNTATV